MLIQSEKWIQRKHQTLLRRFLYVYVLESKKKIVCLEFGTLNEEKPVIEKITVFHFSFIEINVSI